jgi:hypothetical protein
MNVKTTITDWDDLDQVARLFNQTKTRYFQLKRASDNKPTRNERLAAVLDACYSIWDADISSLYSDSGFDKEKKYYVYAHLDSSRQNTAGRCAITSFASAIGMTHIPFYVGKGTGNRCFDTNRSETHRKVAQKVSRMGKSIIVVKLKYDLTESEAFQYEAKLIDIFGLLPQCGYLSNLDEGLHPDKRRDFYRNDLRMIRAINQAIY